MLSRKSVALTAGMLAVVLLLCVAVLTARRPRHVQTHFEIGGVPILKAKAEELSHTIVTPHLEQELTPGKNVLWCCTFQLVWNEFCALSGKAPRWENEPPMVPILNKKCRVIGAVMPIALDA